MDIPDFRVFPFAIQPKESRVLVNQLSLGPLLQTIDPGDMRGRLEKVCRHLPEFIEIEVKLGYVKAGKSACVSADAKAQFKRYLGTFLP